MAKNESLFITIPPHFRCPISLEVMKSPVSLSTGITYDRSSIQTWLDNGHTTCPATMQPLSSPSFVPNLTLLRLINNLSLSPPSPSTLSPSLSLSYLLNKLASEKDLTISLKKILEKMRNSKEIVRVLANSDEFLTSICGLLTIFDTDCHEIVVLELVVMILGSILVEFDEVTERKRICKVLFNGEFDDLLTKFVFVLRNGKFESKIATARVLEKIAIDDNETKRFMIETPSLIDELYDLILSDFDDDVIEFGISAMIAIVAKSRSAKSDLVKRGLVQRVITILCDAEKSLTVVQRAMEMLEVMSTCHEGRAAIIDDEKCVAEIVRRLMKVNEKTTEHGVTVVWSVCYLFRDEKAKEAVIRCDGMNKCLVLLQSNCSGIVKQMCRHLVKVLRVNDKKSCLAKYETKTTHIMPY